MITLGDVKNSRAVQISGCCPSSTDFVNYVNNATRELLKRGNWEGSIQFVNSVVWGDVVTWNRYVGTVLACDVNGRPTQPANFWHDWTPPGTDEVRFRYKRWKDHGCGTVNTVQAGQSPVFNQIRPNEPQYILIFPTNQQDAGKQVTIFGLDQNGQPLLSTRSDGTIQPGETLTLALPYVSSKFMYRRIDRVVKPITQGRLNCFQFDPVLSLQLPLAMYEPTETDPMYQQSRVPEQFHYYPGQCKTVSCPRMISAMVKVEFVPVANDTDLVQIDNLDALALAMQAQKHSDAYDHAGAETSMARALRDLNYQLRDKYPLEQTTVSFRPFGTAVLSRLRLGMQ